MILSKKNKQGGGGMGVNNPNGSHGSSPPIANSTNLMGNNMNNNNNNMYFNESDNFFADQQQFRLNDYNNSVNQYQPAQNTSGGFYSFNSTPQVRSHSPQVYNPNGNSSNYATNTPYNPQNQSHLYTPQPSQQPNFQTAANNKFAAQQLPQQQQPLFNPMQPGANLFNDPMANMAVKYGANLADQGKEYVAQNVDRWFSISKLKYYFAVDTNYVARKLLIILFPFFNRDWTLQYSQTDGSSPVPPKLDVNAPDMYIPLMAFVTYILMVGVCLGTQNKFTPEQLGIQASSSLGWFVIEVFVIFVSLQVLAIKSALSTFDIVAFCGYKYFGMIMCLLGSLLVTDCYYVVLLYMAVTFTYFMIWLINLVQREHDEQ